MGNKQSSQDGPSPSPSPHDDTEMVTAKPLKYVMPQANDGGNTFLDGRARAQSFSPIIPVNAPTALTFDKVRVTTQVNGQTKTLLHDVSGNITGGFWAIMGSSGGGKTTLLSTLSLRLDPTQMDITGEFRLNGREYSRSVLKAMTAYVMQDDLLHGELTVEETLSFAAQLRMPQDASEKERSNRIDEVIDILGIEYVRHMLVGNARIKGISGGERKRLSVAVELLNRPKLLFLDEPTTGLDSTTAFLVCRALKRLAESGECTVVCTIHQPQPKIFKSFDNLILMKKGNIVYQGNAMRSLDYLESIGKPCPQNEDLADHLLNVTAIKEVNDEKLEDLRVPIDLTLGFNKGFYSQDGAKSWLREYRILTKRCILQYVRRYDLIILNMLATVVIAIFIGYGVWHDVGNSQATANFIRPTVFFAMVNQGVVGALQTIIAFPSERAITLRERQAGAYSVSTYYLARTTIDMLSTVIPPIVFSAIVFSAVGYAADSNLYGLYMLFCILNNWAASSLCTAVVCTCVTIERSTVILSFFFEFTRLFGGYYISPAQIEDYPDWVWADALSYLKYTFVGTVLPVLKSIPGHDDSFSNTQKIIDQYGYANYTVNECIAGVIYLIIGFRLIGYLGLRFMKG